MAKFKSKKIDYRGLNAYLYRDFIIVDRFQHLYGMKGNGWEVAMRTGKSLTFPKTKRACITWIDDYYTEMNDYVTNDMEMIND